MTDRRPEADRRPKVVILGAGFGGLWATRALRRAEVDVTLIDRNNFHTFLPLLYQVGAAELEPFAIARPVRTILRDQSNVQFLHASAREIDADARLVRTSRGVYGYDYLIVALGSVAHDFGVPGARAHAFPLKTLEDGVTLRSHVLGRFEAAMHEPDPERRHRMLGFLVIGGGPTGVEYAGALSELIRGPLSRDYPAVAGDARITLVEAGDRLLATMPRKLSDYAAKRLGRMGVEVRLGTLVREVRETGIVVESAGGRPFDMDGDTVAWTAGVRGVPETADWGLPTAHDGRIEVAPSLQVPGRPEVFVVGDLAFPDVDEPPPLVCQTGMQGGEHAARAVLALERGEEPAPFSYRDKGSMAVIGRNAAVAEIGGRGFTGYPAWLLWLGIHIFYLIGFRNRLAVMLNWAWDYVFFERVARILLPLRVKTPAWPEEPGES